MGKMVDTVGNPKANRYRQDNINIGKWQLRPNEASQTF